MGQVFQFFWRTTLVAASFRWMGTKGVASNQLVQSAELSKTLLSKIKAINGNIIKRIVMVDETWSHQYDLESKMQSMQWLLKGSTGPIKFNSERPVQKVTAIVFWDSKELI